MDISDFSEEDHKRLDKLAAQTIKDFVLIINNKFKKLNSIERMFIMSNLLRGLLHFHIKETIKCTTNIDAAREIFKIIVQQSIQELQTKH